MPTPTDGTHRNLIGLQRAVAAKAAGLEARELLREGYGADADRVLDELVERSAEWQKDGHG